MLQFIFLFSLGLLLLASLIVILFLWKNNETLKEEKQKLEQAYQELEGKYVGTHVEQLKDKLNPHLFRNALNAIQSHAYQSYHALDKLSGVLDYILYDSDERLVTLEEEIAFTKKFIEINRLKASPLFDIRIKNKIDLEDERNRQVFIVPLTFVHPIENAFKHADIQSDDAFISITFSFEGAWFVLSVSNKLNSSPALSSGRGGLGNDIYLNRLKTVYGEEGYVYQESVHQEVFMTELKILTKGRAE